MSVHTDAVLVRPALAALVSELRRYRWQIWVDFRKELFSQYRNTVAQALWVVALPLVPLTVYLFLGLLRVFPAHGHIDGIVYATVGAALWHLFSGFVTQPMSAIASKGREAVRHSYPLMATIASSYVQLGYDFAIRALFCAAVLVFVQAPTVLGSLLLVPALVPPLLLFAGTGLILALFSVAVLDLKKLVPILLQYGFFLSLVLFPLPQSGIVGYWLIINPFAVFLDNIRSLLMLGALSDPWAFGAWSLAAAVVFLVALRFFYAAQDRIAEHL